MRTISTTVLALAGLAMAAPAHAWNTSPDVDFEWYASVGRSAAPTYAFPPPRAGYIWSPGHWETLGTRQRFVAGHWIVDDFAVQLATHNPGPHVLIVADPRGELIVTAPVEFPISTR